MEILEKRDFLNFVNKREENVDRSCPYIDKLKGTCSIRKIDLRHDALWYCSHSCKENCPHYHWEVSKKLKRPHEELNFALNLFAFPFLWKDSLLE